MYAESEELHDAYEQDCNPMPDMELERWGGGGVRIFGRGVREKGGSGEPPPEPPWLRACYYYYYMNEQFLKERNDLLVLGVGQ